jgi:hypothetical protein
MTWFALQEDYDGLEKQYLDELLALRSKYRDLYHPLLTKRSDIVAGRVDPALAPKAADAAAPAPAAAAPPAPGGAAPAATEAGAVAPPPVPEKASTVTAEALAEAAKKVVGVPGFWLQAMSNNEVRADRMCMYLVCWLCVCAWTARPRLRCVSPPGARLYDARMRHNGCAMMVGCSALANHLAPPPPTPTPTPAIGRCRS